jgi:hypothetical protein
VLFVFRSDPVLILLSFAGLSVGALTLLHGRIRFSSRFSGVHFGHHLVL